MKYYVIEITTYNDGTKPAYGTYAFDDRTLALASYHQRMAGTMKNASVATEQIVVLNSENGVEVLDMFARPEPEVPAAPAE